MSNEDSNPIQPTSNGQVSLSAQEILDLSRPSDEPQVSLSVQEILNLSRASPTPNHGARVSLSAQQILDLSQPCNSINISDEEIKKAAKEGKMSGSVARLPKNSPSTTGKGTSGMSDEEIKKAAREEADKAFAKYEDEDEEEKHDNEYGKASFVPDGSADDDTLKSRIKEKLRSDENSRHRPVVESRPGPGFRDRAESVDSQDFETYDGDNNDDHADAMVMDYEKNKKDDMDDGPGWDTSLPIAAEVVLDDDDNMKKKKNSYESDAPMVYATAVPESNKKRKRILYSLIATVVLAVVVVIAVVVTKHSSDANGNPPPNSTKTIEGANLTYEVVSFFQVTGASIVPQESSADADDAGLFFGSSVSLSVKGHRLAVGAPGSPNSTTGESFVSIYSLQSRKNITTWLVDIPGEELYDATGHSVSLSGTGDYVAIGSPYFSSQASTKLSPGTVRVHSLNVNKTSGEVTTFNVGSSIAGAEPGDQFGWLVQLSNTGEILLVAAREACYLQAYKLSESDSDSDWVQYGQAINCSGTYDDVDSSEKEIAMHLSNDGSTIVFGEPKTSNGGVVRVFKYQSSDTGSWEQFGNTIEGEKPGDDFGAAVTSNSGGNVIGACAPSFAIAGSSVGRCTFYRNNGLTASSSWTQDGLHLYGDNVDVRFGAAISSIEANANTAFVAISSVDDRSFGESDKGFVQVYEYKPKEFLWNPFSFYPLKQTGTSVSLSYQNPEVVTVAVGTPVNYTSSSSFAGEVNLYKNVLREMDGGVNATVVFHIDDPYAKFNWTLDRMDAFVHESMRIQEGLDETSRRIEFPLPAEALYRISTDTGYIESLTINSKPLSLQQQESKRQTFFTRSKDDSLGKKKGEKFLSLTVDFMSNPEEVQWVLVAEDTVARSRGILAYGPDGGSTYDPQQSQDIRSIDVSNVLKDSKYYFLVTDEGQDGSGIGSVSLRAANKTTGIPNPVDFLNVTNLGWKRRYSNCFFIVERYCNCCFPREVSL